MASVQQASLQICTVVCIRKLRQKYEANQNRIQNKINKIKRYKYWNPLPLAWTFSIASSGNPGRKAHRPCNSVGSRFQ